MDLEALYKLTHGLYVLGGSKDGRLVGSIVDAVMQVANKPVVVALSCSNTSYTKECIESSGEFSLSVLCKDVDPFVVANFGFQTSREVNKWDNVKSVQKDGLPYLYDSLAHFRCKILSQNRFESNTLFVAEVVEASRCRDGDPLTYLDYRSYFKTDVMESFKKFIAEKEKKMGSDKNNGKKWVCTVCGYVYDEETPFEDLPEDWVCPLCGVDKSFFELQDA